MGDHNVNANGQNSRRGGRKRPPNEDDLTDEERCKKQKNREAAKRCRLRKIEESKNLKQQNEELENQNKILTKKKMDLESRIHECILVIKRHQQHGCQLPPDVQGICDSEMFSCSDEPSDFLPVGTHTIYRNQNISSRLSQNETVSIQIPENNREMALSEAKIPTGLFSGTVIQMDESKIRIPKSLSPVSLATQKKDMVTVSDSQVTVQPSGGIRVKHSNSFVAQNGYLPAEDGEGHYQSSSPVQRVPNIDQVPWSLSPKPNGADESGDDDYPYGPRSDAVIEMPTAVNLQSSFDKLCGGVMLNNTPNHLPQDHIGTSQKIELKPLQKINNARIAIKPYPTSQETRSLKQNKSSFTESLQVTTELISQAIHNFHPSEISQSLHDQIVECAKPDSANPYTAMNDKDYLIPDGSSASGNQEEIPQQAHQQQIVYESKPQQLEVIQHQTNKLNTEEISSIPVSYGTYTMFDNVDAVNSNILTSTSTSLSSTLSEIPGMPQSYIITDKIVEHPGQTQAVTLPMGVQIPLSVFISAVAADQIQQSSQPVEETVENSQIPTTVFNVDEENESSESEQNASEKAVSSHVIEHALENTEIGNVPISADYNYSANVSELPSLSFNDLHNTPKEIFDKKPRSRAK